MRRSARERVRDLRLTPPDLGFTGALWRAVDAFRTVSVLYAAFAYATRPADVGTPVAGHVAGWVVLTAMAAWSFFFWWFPRRPAWLVVADLVVCCLAVLASLLVDDRAEIAATNTLPLTWAASAVLSWAVWRGAGGGVVAALAVGAADLVVIAPVTRGTLHNIVLLLMAGAVVGYACTLYEASRRDLAHALEVAAAVRERERLARDIHDSVLQVLAFVQRRGAEIGGAAGDLGRLAGEQEELLRGLVAGAGPAPESGEVDLVALLRPRQGSAVHLSAPAEPVLVPGRVARDLAAAVGAALDNVRAHAGADAQAWVLVEDEPAEVVVSVRDDGVGIEAGRLAEAEAAGRMGMARSVRGRVQDHGGSVSVQSVLGQGTEVELRVPRRR